MNRASLSGKCTLRGARCALPVITVLLLAAGLAATERPAYAEEGRALPAPMVDEQPTGASTSEVAVLAGGCFWGVQGVFAHVEGVTQSVSGYAGGSEATANYKMVSTGASGHAESVRVTFDPRRISYGRILQIYFSVAHDPTQLDRQGPDIGRQYRSAIFPTDPEQTRIAQAYIAQLSEARAFAAPIVTTLEPNQRFYPAEDYHQDFLMLHPTYPYIVVNDLPKIENLKRLFPDRYRAKPVMASDARASN
jgi:peptide-methionine (S)-S-oxide reductase